MFEHCLYFNTVSLARQLEREWSLAFKPFDLTPSQAFMLRLIIERRAMVSTDLAQQLNIAKATCSRVLEGLIQRGYVQKTQTAQDARCFELQPTSAALSIAAPLNQASREVTRRMKLLMGEDAFATTVSRLQGITKALQEV